MDNAPINDEVTTLPCCECGEEKIVNVVYVPYLNGCLSCSDEQCPMKKSK